MDVWAMTAAERNDLADLGDTLIAEQWDTQTLCDDWKVRHVVAHVLSGTKETLRSFLPMLLKSGFNINKALARGAIEMGDTLDPQVLVKELRGHADSRKLPPGVKAGGMLADAVVHTQDIRRAIGVPRVVPEDRLRAALDEMARTGTILGNKKRIAGLRLVATDIDWSRGDGAEVRGTGEALLMAMTGRKVVIDELEGEGVATLRSR